MVKTDDARDMYLELLKKALMHSIWYENERYDSWLMRPLRKRARRIFGPPRGTLSERTMGRVWPEFAHTMIGRPRLDNLQCCVRRVLADGVAGDLIETGAWRGGATIFMRGILKVYGVTDRIVWVADSFEGLPKPDISNAPKDKGDNRYKYSQLAVDLDTVKRNFAAYDLLDDQVKFLKGWFKDTLPAAPITKLAVCRLDGDMYESTMDALVALYPKLSVGGYLIVDDYGNIPTCRAAVEAYRRDNGIHETIESIDGCGVYWRKAPRS